MSKTKLNIDLDDDYLGAVFNCAIRYCIGRQTYMPKLVIDFITPCLPYLSDKSLWCMERDLSDATYFGDESIDTPMWMKFKANVEYEVKRRKGNASNC